MGSRAKFMLISAGVKGESPLSNRLVNSKMRLNTKCNCVEQIKQGECVLKEQPGQLWTSAAVALRALNAAWLEKENKLPVLPSVLEVYCPNAIAAEGIHCRQSQPRQTGAPLPPPIIRCTLLFPLAHSPDNAGERERMAEGSRAQLCIAESLHIHLPNKASAQKDSEDAIGLYQIHASERPGALQQRIQATDRDLPSKCRPCSFSIPPTKEQQDSTL